MVLFRRITLYLFFGIFGLGLAAASLIWFWSLDSAPRHPALAEAELPRLIPVRQFYADQSLEWVYKVSFDGRYAAYRATRLTKQVILIKDLKTGEQKAKITDWNDYFWVPHSNQLRVEYDDRIWEVDPENPDRDNWVGVTPRGFQSGFRYAFAPPTPDHRQVVLSYGRKERVADLYTVDQDGKNKELLIENEGQTLAWILDKDYAPVLRYDRPEKNGKVTRLMVSDDDEWRHLMDVPINEEFYFIEVMKNREYGFAVSSRGRDKAAVVRVNLNDGSEEVIISDPDGDLNWVVNFDPWDDQIDAAISTTLGTKILPLSERGKIFADLVAQYGDAVEIGGFTESVDGRFLSVDLSPDTLGYEFVLMDLQNQTTTSLGQQNFRHKFKDHLATTDVVQFPARDGLMLNGLLVRPRNAQGPMPMVIEVHGGPAAHLRWGYNHFRQFLANRGYAVLALNYRGSDGYGRAFQKAGFGQYGKKMQDDLVDAVNWAVDQKIADPDAIAINGGSYGGYASAMAMVRDPDIFKAAIIEHAMLDVEYQFQFPPYFWGLSLEKWYRYFGNPDDEGVREDMRARSPINRVEDLKGPVLMVAGRQDRVVGFEQTERFITAAENLDKEVEALIFDDEGHGLNHWQSKVKHARRVEDFLAKHLGGRSGNWDWIEPVADFIED
ncbi:MAG: S9 family peptidase [Marinovum sp.]|nr:S9 family peptidase [Marinovum sp.]